MPRIYLRWRLKQLRNFIVTVGNIVKNMVKPHYCEICGELVSCDAHGHFFIMRIEDIFELPVYYCDLCARDTALGSIVHMHSMEVIEYGMEHFDEIWEEVKMEVMENA